MECALSQVGWLIELVQITIFNFSLGREIAGCFLALATCVKIFLANRMEISSVTETTPKHMFRQTLWRARDLRYSKANDTAKQFKKEETFKR